MDRDDARFVVDVLECRIDGRRDELAELRASSLLRLMGAAARIRAVGGDWPPAIVAAAELEDVAKAGAGVCDNEPSILLDQFLETMRKLAAEPDRPQNREERRAKASSVIRVNRQLIRAGRPPILVQ